MYLLKPTLGPPKRFRHLTRAEEVVIYIKATKSHILSRGPPTACQHCGQTLTIEHILLECTVLQAGFYYLIWMTRYPTQLFIKSVTKWRHSQAELIPTTEHHHENSFVERKQRWENPTCERQLICPQGRVSLNKCNPIQSTPNLWPHPWKCLSLHLCNISIWMCFTDIHNVGVFIVVLFS